MQLNTSPAWATAWSAISILESHSKTLYDQKSINELTKSPPYLYQHIRTSDDQNCDSGIDLYEALKFVNDHQLHSFDDFKEFCPKYLPEEIKTIKGVQTRDFRKLFEDDNSSAYKINVVKNSSLVLLYNEL